MSRWVEWGGQYWAQGLFDPPAHLPPGTCPDCGGLGVVPEQIASDRLDVAVACPRCRMYCGICRDWVKRAGHPCGENAK